jgi:hypothetical protein
VAPPFVPEDLLSGEQERASFPASYYVVAADYGIKAHSGTPFASLFGIKGLESVGGSLWLTNWRLVFSPHGVNRFTGHFAIPLSEITVAKDVSRGLKRAVRITAAGEAFDFNLWGITKFLTALEAQRAALDSAQLARYTEARAAAPEPRDPFRRR